MKFKFLFITLLSTVTFAASVYAEQKSSHWVLFGQEESFDHYYDETNFLKNDFDVIGVWVKVVPKNKKARDILFDERRRSAFNMEGYEGYQFTVTAIEINCKLKIKALMESRDYGKGGVILDKVGAVRRNWRAIEGGGRDAFYHKILCDKKK